MYGRHKLRLRRFEETNESLLICNFTTRPAAQQLRKELQPGELATHNSLTGYWRMSAMSVQQ